MVIGAESGSPVSGKVLFDRITWLRIRDREEETDGYPREALGYIFCVRCVIYLLTILRRMT